MRHTTSPAGQPTFSKDICDERARLGKALCIRSGPRGRRAGVSSDLPQLRSAILSGTLRPGTKLPSTRELAGQLGVSRSAVVSAFEQLLAEGYTLGKKGAGTYIASDLPEPFAAIRGRRKRPAPAAQTAASPREPGGFLDVTSQNDERPFNLGRTLRGCAHRGAMAKTQRTQLAFLRTATPWLRRSARHARTAKIRLRLS